MALERAVVVALSGIIAVAGMSLDSKCLAQGAGQAKQETAATAPLSENKALEVEYVNY